MKLTAIALLGTSIISVSAAPHWRNNTYWNNTHVGSKENLYWKAASESVVLVTRSDDGKNASSNPYWNNTHEGSKGNPYWKSGNERVILITREEDKANSSSSNRYWNNTHAGSKENPYWKSPPVVLIPRGEGDKTGNRYWNDTHAGSKENPYWKGANGPVILIDKRAENKTSGENPYWRNTHGNSTGNPYWKKPQERTMSRAIRDGSV